MFDGKTKQPAFITKKVKRKKKRERLNVLTTPNKRKFRIKVTQIS